MSQSTAPAPAPSPSARLIGQAAPTDPAEPLSPQALQAWRHELRAFLAAELPEELCLAARRTACPFSDHGPGMRWLRILARRGWSVPQGPVAGAGTGWGPQQLNVFANERAVAGAPQLAPQGPRRVAPVVLAFGTDEQKARWLPGTRDGLNCGCQGFSEPSSGLDLAALQCRAVRQGDQYAINGTEIWTSLAQHANRIFWLLRSQAGGMPQQGIGFLLFDRHLLSA